jgi:hypothetical protein
MVRSLGYVIASSCALILLPWVSWAAQPHFTACVATLVDQTVVVAGQVAGLGNQQKPPTPLDLDILALVGCEDATATPPTLTQVTPLEANVTYPPKNGNRIFAVTLAVPATLVCVEPAVPVVVSSVVCDLTHDVCCVFPGPEPL